MQFDFCEIIKRGDQDVGFSIRKKKKKKDLLQNVVPCSGPTQRRAATTGPVPACHPVRLMKEVTGLLTMGPLSGSFRVLASPSAPGRVSTSNFVEYKVTGAGMHALTERSWPRMLQKNWHFSKYLDSFQYIPHQESTRVSH